jgi:hypothetical protein
MSIYNNDISVTTDASSVRGMSISWINGPVTYNRFNDISSTGSAAATGIYTDNITLAGSIEYNSFKDISAIKGWSVYGVYIDGDLLGHVDNNTFNNLINTGGQVTGIEVSHNNGGPITGTINNNVFGNIEASSSAAGIYVGFELIGEVSNNRLGTIISAEGNARGLYFDDDVLGSVKGNSIASVTGDDFAYGISVNGNVMTGATISNNKIGDISATKKDAYAITVDGSNAYFSGTLSGNVFGNITSSQGSATGVYVKNNISAGGLIDSNIFGNITGLNSVFGINVGSGGIAGTVSNNAFGNLTSTDGSVSGLSSTGAITGNVENNTFGDFIEE